MAGLAISSVMNIAQQEVKPACFGDNNLHLDFINDMAKRGRGFVILLNVHRVLTAASS